LTFFSLDCRIGDEGASAIATSLHANKILQSLDLSDNHLTNSGAQSIAKMLEAEFLSFLFFFSFYCYNFSFLSSLVFLGQFNSFGT